MSKADPNHQVPPELASSPVPSFEAIRSNPPEGSELRRNQTVPIPIGLRNEVATRGLPSLPAEHLRSTDDMDDQLRPMREGSVSHQARWPLVLGLAFVVLATGVAFALIHTPISPKPGSEALRVSRPELGARQVTPTLGPQHTDPKEVASAEPISASASVSAPAVEKPKARNTKAASGKPGKAGNARGPDESDPNPNELMFKPE